MVSVIGALRQFDEAANFSRLHPYPECWGYYEPGKDCPKDKPNLADMPKICKICPMSKGYKKKKPTSNTGSGGYGEV